MIEPLFLILQIKGWPEFWWIAIGLFGQLLFTGRFVVQWLASEDAGRSVVPVAFWWCSLLGGLVLLSYALARRDPVFVIGQSTGLAIYMRNLWLIYAERRAALADGDDGAARPRGPARLLAAATAWIASDPCRAALWAVAALTLTRLALLGANATELFVDESQYWAWSQRLDWGYFSKPPMVAWVIAATTALGDDSPFWVRAAAPVLHALTALLLMRAAAMLFTPTIAALTALAYVTMPAVTLGSQVISTDTVMMPFAALALLAWAHLRRGAAPPGGDRRWAVALGVAVGAGLMAKYAMAYLPLCAALGALLVPDWRIARRDALVAAGVALALIAPNILWNLRNGMATVRHTADNADWSGVAWNVTDLVEFALGQMVVFGPILFCAYVALIWALLRGARDVTPDLRFLTLAGAPVLLAVCAQALISGANLNWGVIAYAAGTPATVAFLMRRRPVLLAPSFLLHMVVLLAMPILASTPQTTGAQDWLVYERVLGRGAVSERALALAQDRGRDVVISDNRGLLADLVYTARDRAITVAAAPHDGPPRHFYDMARPFDGAQDAVLLTLSPAPPPCRAGGTATRIDRWSPPRGAFRKRTLHAYDVSAACW